MPGEAGDDRRRNVLEHLRRAGREEVSELAKQLVVSTETVRRDLKILERNGLVSRSHGSGGGGNDEQFDEVECLSRMGRTSPDPGPPMRAQVTATPDRGVRGNGVGTVYGQRCWPIGHQSDNGRWPIPLDPIHFRAHRRGAARTPSSPIGSEWVDLTDQSGCS